MLISTGLFIGVDQKSLKTRQDDEEEQEEERGEGGGGGGQTVRGSDLVPAAMREQDVISATRLLSHL